MPDTIEVSRVANQKLEKLDLREVRKFEIAIVPFRCPNCGWDIKIQQAEYQICANCTRLLQVTQNGLVVQPYRILSTHDLPWWPHNHKGPIAWLPFWRVRPLILFEKKRYDDFAD